MTSVSQPGRGTGALGREKAAELSHSLHESAQALTVLQGCLELALTEPPALDQYMRAIRLALDESRRVSVCFDRIRELIRTSQDIRGFAASAVAQETPTAHETQETRSIHV